MAVPISTYHGHAIVENGASVGAERRKRGDDLLREDDERHGRDADRHAEDRVALDRASPEDTEEEAAEQAAVGERRDRRARRRRPASSCPAGRAARRRVSTMPQTSANSRPIAQRARIVGAAAGEREIDVVRRRGGERVDRAGVRAHRRREDRGDEQPDEPVRHLLDDERREDRVGASGTAGRRRTPRGRCRCIRKSANCRITATPLPMIAACASLSDRADSSRCTIS